jgi:ornithine carbamoyltransferase
MNFLTLAELTPSDLGLILRLSSKLKKSRGKAAVTVLRGKTIALVFEKPSTRTRVSFQVAIGEMGGSSLVLSSQEMQLGRGETIEDTAHVLSRYLHGIMARVNKHGDIERLAASASVPVINGLSDLYHPVQILADLLTLQEHKGRLKGLKVAWVGDGNNVCNSWMIGAAMSGIDFVAATPEQYSPLPEARAAAESIAKRTGAAIRLSRDPSSAVNGADCVITDTFISMGFDAEKEERLQAFIPEFQVNAALMSLAKKDAIFQHCLPAHRGEEVTDDVIDGKHSVVFDEAENRLHTTKALLCFLMLGSSRSQRLAKS